MISIGLGIAAKLSKLYLSGIEMNYITGIPRQFINSKLYLSGIEIE